MNKKQIILVSILCLITLIISMVAIILVAKGDKIITNGQVDVETNPLVTTIGEIHGISLTSSTVAPSSPNKKPSEQPITLTAKVVKDEFADATLVWNVNWKNPNSVWATGKNIEDYLKYTISEDNGSITFNRIFYSTAYKAFGEPIIIKCSSKTCPDVYGTCQLDCLKIFAETGNNGTWEFKDGSHIGIKYSKSDYPNENCGKSTAYYDLGVGTIEPEITVSNVYLKFNGYLTSQLEATGFKEEFVKTHYFNNDELDIAIDKANERVSVVFDFYLEDLIQNKIIRDKMNDYIIANWRDLSPTLSYDINCVYNGVVYKTKQVMGAGFRMPSKFSTTFLTTKLKVQSINLGKEQVVY